MDAGAGPQPVLPGDWLGMVGGGQLGRMFCHAAQSLGYRVAVLDPDTLSPAGAVADLHICAPYDDAQALQQLTERCKAVTTEFENVPASSLEVLGQRSFMRPGAHAVAIAQDRIREKAFLSQSGAPVAAYCPVQTADDLVKAGDDLFPGILKVARLGYDGKGQARVRSRDEALEAFKQFGECPCVLEAMLPLASELSVVLARSAQGEIVVFPSAVNVHHNGILAVSSVDTQPSNAELVSQASFAARRIAEALEYVGVLCVEFFVLHDGRLVANEIAPRPHNSGHYSMNACVTSQFEQQARVTAGMPLGDTQCLTSVVMLNLLGDLWFDAVTGQLREPDWAAILALPGVKLHLYGKAEARRGRKMGHVNILAESLETARHRAAQVATILGISGELGLPAVSRA